MIVFEYEKTKLENGYYVVAVRETIDNIFGKTTYIVAEYLEGSWYQTGVDYDPWEFSASPPTIEVIARVHLDKLMIVEIIE